MAICRLAFLRPLRRCYSSSAASSNSYPFNIPSSTDHTSNYDAAPNPPANPQNPNVATPNHYYSPIPNYRYNPPIPPTAIQSPNCYQNSQFSNLPHIPPTAAQSPNYYQNSQFSNPHHIPPTAAQSPSYYQTSQFSNPTFPTNSNSATSQSAPFVPQRSYGFSSAEEAAAERRRRKRRLRIEPPLYALRPNPQTPPPDVNNVNKPRLPDSTSALVGPRLNLHNRVQSLIRAGDLDSASFVSRQSVFQRVRPTVFTCNAIIAAMYRAGRYSDAKALFHYFFRQFDIIPNIVSYNNLIVSHCESNEIEDALKVYEYILENAPYSPSSVTYRHLTKGLIDAGRIDDAVSLLRDMLHKGHGADSLVYNNVISGFLNLGNLEKANELFDELKERCTVYDGVVNATFMDWFFNQGKPKDAMDSYRDLMARNYRMVPATRNVLLETLLKHGKKEEAWNLFHDMLDDHTPPTFQAVNSDTVSMMINECFKEGKIEEAIDVFKRAGKGVKSKPFQMDVAGFNNMMARLCECDMMDEAEQYYKQLCDKSLSPDVSTYRTLIDAYIKVDRADNVLEKYMKMVDAGLRVIPPYANKWFGYLIQKGRASDCVSILSKMAEREPKPDVTTYDVVIRGLVQEGNFDAVANVVRDMVNQGIGSSVKLEKFVLDVFEREGRRMEIENIYKTSFPPHRPYEGTRGPPRVGMPTEMVEQRGRNPSVPQASYANGYPMQTHQPQMAEQITHPCHASEQGVEFPRMAGQSAQLI